MSRAQSVRRIRAVATLLLGICGLWPGFSPAAENAPAEPKPEEKEDVRFTPEVKEKLAELLRKISEAKQKLWITRMKKELDEMRKAVALSEDEAKALQLGADRAVETSVKETTEKLNAEFKKDALQANQGPLLPMLEQALQQVDAMVAQADLPGSVDPQDQPVWAATLKQTLTAEQAAAWNKTLADRKDVVEKETGDLLKGMKETTREQFAKEIGEKVGRIEDALAPFPKERAEQLEGLAKEAVNKALERWQKDAEKVVLAMSPARRKQAAGRRGGLYIGRQNDAAPDRQAVWTEGLAKFLSADDQKKIENIKDQQKQRRIRIMAQVMVTILDEKIAFTAKQRGALESIAGRLVTGQAQFFPEETANNYNYTSFSPGQFFAAGSKAGEAELQPILEEAQLKHWKEYCDPQASDGDPDGSAAEKIEDRTAGLGRALEPETVEHGISDLLTALTLAERKRSLDEIKLKAEDAARVARLEPPAVDRLQTAARGAAEKSLQDWKTNTEQTVRSALENVTPENVKQRLASIENEYSYQRGEPPAGKAIWEKAVKRELTDDQRAAWKKEVDAREQYARKTMASAIMAEFDRKTSLKAEQWEKIEPLAGKIIQDYAPDIATYFSYNNGSAWYLQYYSKFIPIVGIPEKDLKEILTKSQWDLWTGCNEYSNATNYWGNLQRNHDQRVKANKR